MQTKINTKLDGNKYESIQALCVPENINDLGDAGFDIVMHSGMIMLWSLSQIN